MKIFVSTYYDRLSLFKPFLFELSKYYKIDIFLLSGEPQPEEILKFQEKDITLIIFPSHKIFYFNTLHHKLNTPINSFKQYILEKLFYFYESLVYLYIQKLIKKQNYCLHLTYGGTNWIESMTFKAFKDAKIYTITPYFMIQPGLFYTEAIASTNDLPYLLHSDSTYYQQKTYQYYLKKHPSLFNNGYSRLLSYHINSLKKHDALPEVPFILGGYDNHYNIICQNHTYGFNALLTQKINPNIIEFYEDINSQLLLNSYVNITNKNKYREKNFKIIIIALTQFTENRYMNKKKSQREHEYLLRIITSIPQTKTLISLHPVMEYNDYKYLEKKYNCQIIKESLPKVLPHCDLFISAFSNTLLWTLQCSIPAINLDYFNWSWDKNIIKQYKSINTLNNKSLLYKTAIQLLYKQYNFDYERKKGNLSNIHSINTLQNYRNLITKYKGSPKIKTKYFFTNILLHFLTYLHSPESKIINQIQSKDFYIMPYTPSTIQTLYKVQQVFPEKRFLGFLDNNKTLPNLVFSPLDINKNSTIIVGPSKYSQNIVGNLKNQGFKLIYQV